MTKQHRCTLTCAGDTNCPHFIIRFLRHAGNIVKDTDAPCCESPEAKRERATRRPPSSEEG
jgi:hypothetical protein